MAYIDLEKLRDDVLHNPDYDNDTTNYFLDLIDSQPVANVENVVYCKDCEQCNKK